jgi:glutamate/tyrosine decarboxylase-like PLP-dependent enzyme
MRPDWILMKFPDQSHSSVERAGLLGGVRIRLLPADENFRLRGETLRLAVEEDKAKGKIPCYVSHSYLEHLRDINRDKL